MTSLPNPPVLKTTIIQLNKDLDYDDQNYEILTNDYLQDEPAKPELEITTVPGLQKKKRRRSSANIDSEELAKRKNETKQLHSIIEKRRRIKINREFEALKYLIPACRSSSNTNSPQLKPKKSSSSASNNNGNKIDGMYKLTILKSSVEYILYLHHIIQKQQEMIQANDKEFDFNIDFAKIPLNVNQYRNIDKEFNFKDLLAELDEQDSAMSESSSRSSECLTIKEEHEEFPPPSSTNPTILTLNSKTQLPSPAITPDIAPILSMLNKYSSVSQAAMARKTSLPVSPNTVLLQQSSYKMSRNNSAKFSLPDPAINPATLIDLPKKKYFKSKPLNNNIIHISGSSSPEDDAEDASNTLLALRKSNIDSLLN